MTTQYCDIVITAAMLVVLEMITDYHCDNGRTMGQLNRGTTVTS